MRSFSRYSCRLGRPTFEELIGEAVKGVARHFLVPRCHVLCTFLQNICKFISHLGTVKLDAFDADETIINFVQFTDLAMKAAS